MNTVQGSPVEIWPLVAYFFLVVMLLATIVGLSYVIGERHKSPETNEPFESGIVPAGLARLRLSAKFYLIAVFFVIFDVEAAFLFAWAIAFRELGWAGYVEALIFIAVLGAALAYLWRLGALDWGTPEDGRNWRRSRVAGRQELKKGIKP
ncbi:MAG TPA: NADH-quinone oxidoreductase subunit A [Nitrosospira sp.]|nr:NADH-quinone oxidoreductase subunit A [Nitrosospira sp.]